MIKNKDVYYNSNFNCNCDRFENCVECGYGCPWFENDSKWEIEDKLPMIKYEYQ